MRHPFQIVRVPRMHFDRVAGIDNVGHENSEANVRMTETPKKKKSEKMRTSQEEVVADKEAIVADKICLSQSKMSKMSYADVVRGVVANQ